MPSPLDNVLERQDGPEPRVLTVDVRAILQEVVRPDSDDSGRSVALIAEKAGISTRTVYRVLNPEIPDGKKLEDLSINLGLADALCLAADSHISYCRLVYPDGTVTSYH